MILPQGGQRVPLKVEATLLAIAGLFVAFCFTLLR